MDAKKITRGDAIVALSALLIFIFSFMPFLGKDSFNKNMWWGFLFPLAPAIVLVSVIVAAISIAVHTVPGLGEKNVLGVRLGSWPIPLSVTLIWDALWTFVRNNDTGGGVSFDLKYGAIISLLMTLVLGGTVIATAYVPALNMPLGVGGGVPAGGAPGYSPAPGQPYNAPMGGAPGYGAAPAAAAPAPAPAAAFAPYWFSVPDQRPLHDPNSNTQTNSLNPGVWYLAVQQHGQGLLVEVDGVRGVLWNAEGIQKSS